MPFQSGQSGNPAGRPRGSRNKGTIIAEKLFDDSAGELTRAAIARALDGDPVALRACMDRLLPPLRHRPLDFDLPQLVTLADAPVAINAIAQGLAHGELDREGAAVLLRAVREFTRALAAVERETRAAGLAAQAVDATRPGLNAADGPSDEPSVVPSVVPRPLVGGAERRGDQVVGVVVDPDVGGEILACAPQRGEQHRESIGAPEFPARNTGATAICEMNANFSRRERGSRVTASRRVADRRMSRRCRPERSTWKSVCRPNSQCV
jgi:hypothetical protein